ncbi:unnamed protein product [Mytilus edulis]|uniref:Death domain-containing protein n=1 Tax=Mytilus edulis TaxID=6550 RepID=A0A8S3QGV1_MYTED|nr:unnamed protein product [Mytilus edulis]
MSINLEGRSALDLALINKDQGLVKLLSYFGTEVLVQDWIVFTIDLESLDKKERPSIKLVHEQNDRLAAMEFRIHGICKCSVLLEANESIFSDVFEVIAWGSKPDTITFEIKVEGRPRCNERILMLPIEGEANIDIISQLDENTNEEHIETTNISVKVNLKTITKFAIKVKEVPEIFSVSHGSGCFKPEMEPNATIDIPEGAFLSGGKLQVNISETKDWNDENIEDEIPVLFTNAMDLTMLNDSQPNQPVKLKIPIHSCIPNDDDVVILASENELPEESDWEVRREVQIELHVIIQQKTQTTYTNPSVSDTSSFGTCCCQKSIEPLEAGTKTSYVPGFEFELALPVDTQVPGTIPVLRRESLRRIVSSFSEEECFYLGRHLNIPTKTIEKLRNEETIRERLLQIWRPNRPNERLVHNLVDALKAIEKEEEANNVEEAFSSSMEYLE